MGLEVLINEPFDPSLIESLYADKRDLALAWPAASYPFKESEWRAQLEVNPANTSLVFQHQSKTVGHVALLVKEDELYLCFVILLPEFRGQGLAEKMILASEEFARINFTHQEILLHVRKENNKAKALYEKLGYVTYLEFDDKFRMKKSL